MEPSAPGSPKVFLSYRREDSAGHAGRLADHLLARFGSGSVFMDVESIAAGKDFTQEIARAIDEADAVLVVIGLGWLDAATPIGRRRLEDPADFVRLEISAALNSDTRVLPVLVGGASMPAEGQLPEELSALARRNAVELLDRRWREDVDALVDVLEGRDQTAIGSLPVQPTPFLGRADELAELVELLRRQHVRLLTLTGPGGIGKTRLAVHVASKLAYAYPGGAWFVALAALTDPELALAEIAHVLDVREAPEGSLVRAIAERLSRDRTLIVLDNLEQLLPEGAASIAELSTAASQLDLIVSSREPLHVSAEREYPVRVLSEDEAVALFLARARAVHPGFAPRNEAERAAISAICARLDRLPLAIELAAARTTLLSPSALLERLEQRLPLLTGGARDAPERQRTLRATIAWSHDLLSEDERALFERLAVFAGGFTLEAAEAVCDADLDTVQSLIERNLVRQDAAAGAEPRFLMLETIREFALERLEETSEAEGPRRRLAEHLVAVAEAAEPELRGPNRSRWLDRLDAEHDNHRAALRWALDGADPELGLRLAAGLSTVWWLRRPLSEARRWLMESIERTPPVATKARAWALASAGFFAGEQGDDAIPLLEESIRCAREAGALATQALATTNLSGSLPAARKHEMIPLGQEGLRLARASGERWILAVALNNLGESYRDSGDIDAATVAYEESLTVAREVQNLTFVANSLVNLAEIAVGAGDHSRARSLSVEAFELAETMGDRVRMATSQAVLGWVALAEQIPDEAAERFAGGLVVARDLGHWPFAVSILFGLAGVAACRSQVERAARLEAVAARSEELLGHIPTAADSGIHLRYLDELRSVTNAADWQSAAREGAAMNLEDAIAYALSTPGAMSAI